MSKSSVDVALGERCRILRERRGLSASEVGRAVGVSYQQVRKYENATNRISASMLYQLAIFLNVNVDAFFRGVPRADELRGRLLQTGADAVTLNREGEFLSGIGDPEVREHLAGLLPALADKR